MHSIAIAHVTRSRQDNYIASGDAAGDAMLHIIKPDLAAATKAGKRPGSESHFLKYATRLQSPVRAVAFNGSGLRLAVGGEAGEVKVINTSDTCQLLSLNATNTEAVLHLAFDASNIYLVSQAVLSIGGSVICRCLTSFVRHTQSPAGCRQHDRLAVDLQHHPSGRSRAIQVARHRVERATTVCVEVGAICATLCGSLSHTFVIADALCRVCV